VAATIGLAAILSCGWLIDGVKQFPGPWALVPVGATVLMILAAANRQADPRTRDKMPLPNRVLALGPLVTLGSMAYSLYLWQQIFLNRASATEFSGFPLNLTLAIAAALGSYYLVERPSLRLRRRIEKRRVPAAGREDDRAARQGVAIHGIRASNPLISAPGGSPSVDFSPPR